MTPLGMACSYCFHEQSNQMPVSKWITECARDKELSSSQTSYSSSSVPWNSRQSIALLHSDVCTRLELLEKLEFCYETSLQLFLGNRLPLFHSHIMGTM